MPPASGTVGLVAGLVGTAGDAGAGAVIGPLDVVTGVEDGVVDVGSVATVGGVATGTLGDVGASLWPATGPGVADGSPPQAQASHTAIVPGHHRRVHTMFVV